MNSDANSLIVLGEVDSLERVLYWVIAAIAVPIIVAFCRRWYDSTIANQERRRTLYSEAYATCLEYREYPFVIYRRNHKQAEDERTRISSSLTAIQKTMAFHRAWIRTESETIADAYDQLCDAIRRVAGGEIKKSWNRKPIKSDGEMTVGPKIDMSAVDAYQEVYMQRVKYALRPFFIRLFLNKPRLVDDIKQKPKADTNTKEVGINIGPDKHDGNRLLIATFIVAATIASFQLNIPTSVANNAVSVGVIGTLGFGLLSSSVFAFTYIMSKGYALRYQKSPSRVRFVDRYGHHMYNWAIFIFLPVIAVVAATYTIAMIKNAGVLSEAQLNTLMWYIAIPLTVLFNLGQIVDIISLLKERKSER